MRCFFYYMNSSVTFQKLLQAVTIPRCISILGLKYKTPAKWADATRYTYDAWQFKLLSSYSFLNSRDVSQHFSVKIICSFEWK